MRPCRSVLNSKSLSLIGIPVKFQDKTVEDFETFSSRALSKVKNFISEYLENLRIGKLKGLFLFGSNGVGKSMLACIIAKEAYKYRYSVKRVTFIDYINQYTKVWSTRNFEEKEQLEEYLYSYFKGVEFLVLEEVGKEIDSSIAAPILEDLLRYREDKELTTIICTNLNVEIFKEKYGASCFSLLQGNMIPVKIESVDRREHFFESKV